MCVEKISFRGGMDADAHTKLISSSQAVGLLAVLADSGNVILRTFGKQELRRHVLAAHTNPTPNPLVHEITRELSAQTMDKKPQALTISSSEESRARVKKVRFAPDVVEPAGDSRAYRGKNEANIMAKKKVCAVEQEGCKAQTLAKPYLPANRMLLYKGKQLCRV